jgi:hypothetical protein
MYKALAVPDSAPRAAAPSLSRRRPKLTAETVVDYIDWVMENLGQISEYAVKHHLNAAELVIRTLATEAQGKATQHTLVEDGVIDPPPHAS